MHRLGPWPLGAAGDTPRTIFSEPEAAFDH